MKISKSLIQAIALAVTVATVSSSCSKGEAVNPKEKKLEEKKLPDNCPACGMG